MPVGWQFYELGDKRSKMQKSASYVVAATKLPITKLTYFAISGNMKQDMRNSELQPNENLV